MSQSHSHKLHVVLANGRVVQFTMHELRSLIYGRHVLILSIALLVAIGIADPAVFPTLPDIKSRLFYWTAAIILYLLLLPYWVQFLLRLWPRVSKSPLPLMFATIPLVAGITIICAIIPAIFGDLVPPRGAPITWVTFVQNALITQLVETTTLVWLLPIQRLDNEKGRQRRRRGSASAETEEPAAPAVPAEPVKPATPAVPAIRYVVLSGRSLPVSLIRIVRSAEHYLVVSSKNGTVEVRARMKDYLEQLSDEDGIQTHRSYWVARDEAVEMSGANVKTVSGEVIPVSRGRLPMVREWFRRRGKPH